MCTKETEIWDAMVRISAQETTPGQTFSSAVLMSSTTEYPSAEFIFGFASFSLTMPSALSSNIDPSQPCLLFIMVNNHVYQLLTTTTKK